MTTRSAALLTIASILGMACTHLEGERAESVSSALKSCDHDLLGLENPAAEFENATGSHKTVSTAPGGAIDTENAFFKPTGTNGRACVTCHSPREQWGTSVDVIRRRFYSTCKGDAKQLDPDHDNSGDTDHTSNGHGKDSGKKRPTCGSDPLFRPIDGANSPDADVSTDAARVNAYSMLLKRGLIRIEMPVPATTDFTVVSVSDPYGYATTNRLSFYRRPLPATNLKFSGAFADPAINPLPIMWDGRESETSCIVGTPAPGANCATNADCSAWSGTQCITGRCRIPDQCANPNTPKAGFPFLKQQANNAHLRHAQASAPLSDAEQTSIADFERNLFTAQERDKRVGSLSDGANGGAQYLSTVPFFVGENRSAPIGPGHTVNAFTIYSSWTNSELEHRASVARGQVLFNTRNGVNPKIGGPIQCTFCHAAFDAGGDGAGTWGNGVMNSIGSWISQSVVDSGEFPVYTVRRNSNPSEVIVTTDLGRGAVTGRFNDIGKYKANVLRGMVNRAPYFHNGSAKTLGDVVDAYEAAGFHFNWTPAERQDLINFLEAL